MKYYLITLVLIIACTSAFSQQHPRMFFNSSEKTALQLKSKQEPFAKILNQVRIQYKQNDLVLIAAPTNYDSIRSQPIQAALSAFLYAMTDSVQYAQKAMQLTLNSIYGKVLKSGSTTQYASWGSPSIKGLSSYWQGVYIAYAYDMCYQAWPDTFKVSVSKKIKLMADMISTNGGAEQNTNSASNWQGIRGAAAILCYLASDETYTTTNFQNSLLKMNTYLIDNLGDVFNSKGWNIEGLGYMYYPMGNYVGPAMIALQRNSPIIDFRKYPSVVNNYCSIYSSLLSTLDYKGIGSLHPDFGDDNPLATGEGTFGQAFYFLPDSLKQGAKFCYDKIISTSKTSPYDNYRFGAVYSYLYYPENVIAKNPKEISAWNDLDADYSGNGYFNYRNKYENNDDALAQMYLKFRGNRGHNGPDALTFRIFAKNTPWAIGGGRYGVSVPAFDLPTQNNDVYICSMNTLYPGNPDNKITSSGNSGVLVGNPLITSKGNGHVISSISLNNVGVSNQKRWFIADYDSIATGSAATYIIGDMSDNGKVWQMCTYEENVITTSGNTFTITSPTGQTMKGTVLYPTSNFRFNVGKRKRGSAFGETLNNSYITFMSDNGDYLVSLTIANQGITHPVPTIIGSGVVGSKIQVGNKSFSLTDNDVLYNEIAINKAPKIDWSVSKSAGPAPFTFVVNGKTSVDSEGENLIYKIDFGDGVVSTSDSTSHTFTSEGNYYVKLKVTDPKGLTSETGTQISVWNSSVFPNFQPSISLISPASNSQFNNNISIDLKAAAWDLDGFISKIDYFAVNTISPFETIKIYTNEGYPLVGKWTNPVVGVWDIYADVYDNNNLKVTSSKKRITVKTTTDIAPLYLSSELANAQIFPNPIHDNKLYLNCPLNNTKYSISDLAGKIIIVGVAQQGLSILKLDGLRTGIYMISLANNANNHNIKLIVQ